jgi:putative alpha-1,2-mannosidase
VPHDPEGLIAKVGKAEFNNRLDSTFVLSEKDLFGGGEVIDAFAGINKLYNHGNQPCLHYSWLFNYSGMPSKTQKWVRAICNNFYGTEGIHGYGYGQDEDQGQLGGWYVMAAIGLFDVKGLVTPDSRFGIGSPLFDKITIHLNRKYYQGDQFVIETENNGPENFYIQSMAVNGKKLYQTFVPFSTIVSGGNMKIELGSAPKNYY